MSLCLGWRLPPKPTALSTGGAVNSNLSPPVTRPLLAEAAVVWLLPVSLHPRCPRCSYVNVAAEAVCSERFQEKGDTSYHSKRVINTPCCLWPVVKRLMWLPGNDCVCIWFLYLHLGVRVVHLCKALWTSPQSRAVWEEVVGEPRRQHFASVSRACVHTWVWVTHNCNRGHYKYAKKKKIHN